MSDSVYQVVGECAHATVDTAHGRTKMLLYKGAIVPSDAPELEHLLDTGLVAKTSGDETGGVNADGLTAVEVDQQQADAEREAAEAQQREADEATADAAEVEARRDAARAKLPTDGSMPDGRASQAVWVEYHVAQGGNYDELVKQDKQTLVELAKSRQG